MTERINGLGVSAGVVVGRVVLLPYAEAPIVPAPVPPERVGEEIERFERARDRARRELEELRDRTREALGDSYAGILDAQLLILVDRRLVSETVSRIRVGRVTASWALKEVVGGFMRKFEAIDDRYLRERGGDLEDVHARLQRILRGEQDVRADLPSEGPQIVVAHTLGPSDSVLLAQRNIAGFATDVGGRTSHTAILAQALSVPAVVGLSNVTQRVRTGDVVVVDGDDGTVLISPSEADVESAQDRRRALLEREESLSTLGDAGLCTLDGVEIAVQANVEFSQEVDKALRFGARGIGLYRSEFLFLARSPELPSEAEHFETYAAMADKMAPHPVTIRTLDLGGEKYFHEVLRADESNPVLGLRAVRLCLKRPDVFRPQLRGLLRAATRENVRVMIPLVTTLEEIRDVRALLASEAEALRSEGIPCRADVPVGIMVEVPAAAGAAAVLAREAAFFSIGTNDLIQYALAVDRANESVAYLYQPLHPAVLRMLRFIVESARRGGIPVALCGEMAADAALAGLLIGMGLREFSVQPRAIVPVGRAIRTVDVGRESARIEALLAMGTSAEIEAALRGTTPARP